LAPECQKKRIWRRALALSVQTRQFVSLAQEFYWHGFGSHVELRPRFVNSLSRAPCEIGALTTAELRGFRLTVHLVLSLLLGRVSA